MATPSGNWRTDGTRLWDSLMRMAQIGPGLRGGNNRQTLTDADREGRLLFQHWCEAAGLSLGIDAMGTMFARRAGTDPEALPVMIGSHLDTQPTGGRFDGVLGVLGALEVVRTLNDLGIRTKHPVEVVNWTNEEGARFPPAMGASAVYAGVMSLEAAYATRDAEGRTLGAELERIGFKGEEPVGARKAQAYFELHIEQGPILEAEGREIGVVTHGQGTRWLEVTLTGREAHTGSTPMPRRLNAGLGAARIIERVDNVAWKHAPLAVGAVGQIDVFPNSRNIITGKAVFTIDIRHPELAVLEAMAQEIRAGAAEIAERMGLAIAIAEVNAFDPVAFDPTLVGRVRAAATALGYSHRDMVSGAGHDACWVNKVAPAAMIFCPCVDGLSHNEDEAITPEWAKAGADVLLHAVLETAQIA
ncbi:N-carbamoyl-L-amino-acid hydrolase [Angulomicrobium tetraedrale]|uniref:N-carbamoyl-L-amino-acid hydrolase n=1 Tax=Ancylobacter tetraedralis TaxID=217068 RepID=A0A839ZFP8_9HYPH|nr:Zn-dependent hydrolase [Ancylobacter tetraedralis]MBB3773653.1 N-carbamoyl-L-amino-acid hydrolase [Ancylobacter tetraedralis]